MSNQYIQLKNSQGDLLYPRTEWALIQNKPALATTTDLNLKQDVLTSANAGSNITITTVNGVLRISAASSSNYNDLTSKPSINGVTLSGSLTAADLNLVKGGSTGANNLTLLDSTNNAALQVINGYVVTANFDSRALPTTLSAFTNDVGFITASYHDSTKQNLLTSANAGSNVTITTVDGVLKINATGGTGGTTDYNALNNRPTLNGMTISGARTGAYYKLATVQTQAGVTSFYDDSNNAILSLNNGQITTNAGTYVTATSLAATLNAYVPQSFFPTVPDAQRTYAFTCTRGSNNNLTYNWLADGMSMVRYNATTKVIEFVFED